ncbi:hypothetical protein KSP35_21200 [Aquihabitans sp. G128]|uniref:hypothetical protein n=1 Tax=Aquihabitans sp. G128 TaxID=2849779 RepID=UPI001C214312|nr:hypothetical protein [Aquihabitans sp. G128]QXC60809.1 hypothetical protein KSP35_21200 [Aquihabitans sp. G128]
MSGLQAFGPKARAVTIVGALVVLVGSMALFTLLFTLIWPGEARYVAELRCDDAHPEAVVVQDTQQTSDGTSTDFTVYCVSPDGDAIDQGWAPSFLALWALHTAAAGVLVALGLVRRRARRRRRLAQA